MSNCGQWMQIMGLEGVFSSFVIGLIWPQKVICSRVVLLLVSSFFDYIRGLQCRDILLLVSLLRVTARDQGVKKAEDAAIQFSNQHVNFYPPLLNVFHHSRLKLRNSSCLQFIPLPSVTGIGWKQFRDGRPGGNTRHSFWWAPLLQISKDWYFQLLILSLGVEH